MGNNLFADSKNFAYICYANRYTKISKRGVVFKHYGTKKTNYTINRNFGRLQVDNRYMRNNDFLNFTKNLCTVRTDGNLIALDNAQYETLLFTIGSALHSNQDNAVVTNNEIDADTVGTNELVKAIRHIRPVIGTNKQQPENSRQVYIVKTQKQTQNQLTVIKQYKEDNKHLN